MPTVQALPYANFLSRLLNKEIDIDTDDIRAALVTNAYTPDRDLHDYWNDVVANELATASGYTANGVALTTKAFTTTAANSWTRQRANSTAYTAGDLVRPATGNGFVYMAAVGGTSGVSIPTYPTTIGVTVADGGVTWTCVGRNVVVFKSDPASWSAPFDAGPFRHVVLYDRTPATDATRPLIAIATYVSDQTGLSGSATVTPDSVQGWVAIPVP